ncbi:MAG: hydroxymethylbilane synthase [Actinomycetota bacterium]|nr:hydroxymethylbilane synthase [Actinomycetota bacterium]
MSGVSPGAVSRPLRLGSRRSALALTQSGQVAQAVQAAGAPPVEVVEVTTFGDTTAAALETLGGTGVFVTTLRDKLLSGEVDLAVHSLKDLPTAPAEGLVVAAVPVREDPRDVLIARDGLTLGELPPGSTVGTGAPRRAAQLRALGFDLNVLGIRGNVDTRLSKVTSGELDAVVLARAGLARLGRLDEVTEVLDPLQMLPSPGQGALAIECRSGDAGLIELLASLDDPATRAAVTAERSLLGALEAGCTAPVGALADISEDADGALELYLRAVVAAPDGSLTIRLSATGPLAAASEIGSRLAADLLDAGAADLMESR